MEVAGDSGSLTTMAKIKELTIAIKEKEFWLQVLRARIIWLI